MSMRRNRREFLQSSAAGIGFFVAAGVQGAESRSPNERIAMAAIGVVCWRQKIPFWVLADAAALFASLGQAFGRIGNIINGDIVGYPTNLPWGFVYQNPGSFVADHTVAYLPAAAYELVFNLAMFAVLWSLRFRLRRSGMLFVVYLIMYSVGQFVLFFWRDNVIFFWGLKQAQLTALGVLVLTLPLWWWIRTHNTEQPATVT